MADLAKGQGVTVAFETGQETADLLRLTLDELRCPNLKVNFDPANMLLYDKGDPIRALEILGDDGPDRAERFQLLFSREYEADWRERFGIGS